MNQFKFYVIKDLNTNKLFKSKQQNSKKNWLIYHILIQSIIHKAKKTALLTLKRTWILLLKVIKNVIHIKCTYTLWMIIFLIWRCLNTCLGVFIGFFLLGHSAAVWWIGRLLQKLDQVWERVWFLTIRDLVRWVGPTQKYCLA